MTRENFAKQLRMMAFEIQTFKLTPYKTIKLNGTFKIRKFQRLFLNIKVRTHGEVQ